MEKAPGGSEQAPQTNVYGKALQSVHFDFCAPPFVFVLYFLFCFWVFFACRELYGGSVIVTSHTPNTYLKGVLISKPVFGVIIHLKCTYLL